jgi:hypothetical protein
VIITDVWVPGAAKTKGSMEVINRATGAMRESVDGSPRWRVLMAQAVCDDIARRRHGSRSPDDPFHIELPYPGAVSVVATFYLSPPAGWVARFLGWSPWPIWERAGDVDKLARNVLDALGSKARNTKYNGGAITDDNLVVQLNVAKLVADPAAGRPAGVRIIVTAL